MSKDSEFRLNLSYWNLSTQNTMLKALTDPIDRLVRTVDKPAKRQERA
ncbi:hypothetical protein [Vulcanisaeta sp. JCM 16161]|nr:hypothetical protein [Vulcanisaeta sp. JCM 16161]